MAYNGTHADCPYCTALHSTDNHYPSLHIWRTAPTGFTHYTACNAYTVTLLPAGSYSLYSRASGLYSLHPSLNSAIAAAR